MSRTGQWADLRDRVIWGVAMMLVAVVAIWQGGIWFQMLVPCVGALILWEIWSMARPDAPDGGVVLAVLSAALVFGVSLDPVSAMVLLLVPPVIIAVAGRRHRVFAALMALAAVIACEGLLALHVLRGAHFVVWLVAVVVATDIAGYFAGRMIGGPKFWPAVSPKKTWSGTAAGWIAAALVGVAYALWRGLPLGEVVALSAVLSLASQMGDLAQSALKRRMGVKDSSHLIPGHGGVFDRFDGVIGASLVLTLVLLLTGQPWSLA